MTFQYTYRFDAERYHEQCEDVLGEGPTSETIESLQTIVDWCCEAYVRGQNGEPFVMPNCIPTRKYLPDVQVAICESCGEKVTGEVYVDEMGLHMNCDNCGEEIDVDAYVWLKQ